MFAAPAPAACIAGGGIAGGGTDLWGTGHAACAAQAVGASAPTSPPAGNSHRAAQTNDPWTARPATLCGAAGRQPRSGKGGRDSSSHQPMTCAAAGNEDPWDAAAPALLSAECTWGAPPDFVGPPPPSPHVIALPWSTLPRHHGSHCKWTPPSSPNSRRCMPACWPWLCRHPRLSLCSHHHCLVHRPTGCRLWPERRCRPSLPGSPIASALHRACSHRRRPPRSPLRDSSLQPRSSRHRCRCHELSCPQQHSHRPSHQHSHRRRPSTGSHRSTQPCSPRTRRTRSRAPSTTGYHHPRRHRR